MKKFTKIALVASAIGGAACLVRKIAEDEDVKEKLGKAKEAGMKLVNSFESKLSETNAENAESDISSDKETEIDYANATDFEGWTKADIERYVKTVMDKSGSHYLDPFFDDAVRCMFCACMGLLVDYCGNKTEDAAGPLTPEIKSDILKDANRLKANRTSLNLLLSMDDNELNTIVKRIDNRYIEANLFDAPYCVRMWRCFKLAPEKTRAVVMTNLRETLEIPMPAKHDEIPKVEKASIASVLTENEIRNETQESEVFFDDSTESAAEETKEEIRDVTNEKNEVPVSSESEASDVVPEAEETTGKDMTGEDMLKAIREINESNPDIGMANSENNDEDWV